MRIIYECEYCLENFASINEFDKHEKFCKGKFTKICNNCLHFRFHPIEITTIKGEQKKGHKLECLKNKDMDVGLKGDCNFF